ncbi:PucR family transcriptional regulator ligand-binding domain-containing protein [Cellulomonas dongxiuzhuiae]|uniref:PucR family transcriptional regulator ligand-binding domain-containing protein n=2 Tax=Cellulomonas dongxiuzhuiae TaxID=2819979 RepID=A0ABX8GP13_9CELL|nr:PucR family transcriptional regulator ligand-binding domain-containing protein [Cellulomonas dongxiuzhuiae]QWC17321.1 PucR family transcriptional regulator ligand-binding domain-containing protein [Cellulomonas dongxiuzhuiae]
MMTLAPLRGAYVLAGDAGVDRLVSGVNVMEVPDIAPYIKPGELLLTTAYPVRERPEDLVDLLRLLSSRGLAALAIKPLRYLDRLPDRFAEIADELAFPVLVVPGDTSFNEVIAAVLAVVLAEHDAEPAHDEVIRERLTGIALAGGGLAEIARTLSGALDRPVDVVADDPVLLGGTVSPPSTRAPGPAQGASRWEFPVTVAGVRRGHVVLGGDGEPTRAQRRLIRQACFAAGMHIAQALASIELDRRLRVVFLEELVTATPLDAGALEQRARLFGWDLGGTTTVVVAACDAAPPEQALQAAARRTLGAGAVAWLRGTQVVAIAPGSGGAEEAFRTALGRAGAGSVVVASGCPAETLTALPRSHATAQEVLQIAGVTGRATARHDDLGFERLVLSLRRDLLQEYVDAQIGPLLRHDAQADGDLCRTLEVFLGLGNAAEAARRLFVHYNTMKHRLQRIGDLLEADLHDPRTRTALALALEAHRLVRPPA